MRTFAFVSRLIWIDASVFVAQVKVGGGGAKGQPAAAAHKTKSQEGFMLEYKVKRRIPLESISEIKMR